MTKSESFSWQPTHKVCTNGLYDFGLLRDKPEHEEKPKLFSLYFSRTVLIVGIVAGFTFAICLILADKYQKSAKISHHYASSYIYQKEGENFEPDKSYYNGTKRRTVATVDAATAADDDTIFNSVGLKRIQNISKNIRIDDINHLMPITTVLHSVNASSVRGGRAYQVAGHARRPTTSNHLRHENGGKVGVFKSVSNLAELLKRTEIRAVRPPRTGAAEAEHAATTAATTEANAMQFAQLENYKHHVNVKNLQDLLKYVTCVTATDCGRKWQATAIASEPTSMTSSTPNSETADKVRLTNRGDALSDDQRLQVSANTLSNHPSSQSQSQQNIDMLSSESSVPLQYIPYVTDQQTQPSIYDQFYHYRASNPMEINQLEPMPSVQNRVFHRFSNRMYNSNNNNHNREFHETPKIYTSAALEPYLKPPTPPPTALSFTPSYTTAIFNGFEDVNNAQEVLKAEATAVEPSIHIKPISLMVEIFPATDYELPGSLFQENSSPYMKQQEHSASDTISPNTAFWLPWKLAPLSHNKMRLFVNLFPQYSKLSN